MSFTFNCPHCQVKIEAEEEWIGQEAECPGCGKPIKVENKKPLILLKPINPQPSLQPQEQPYNVSPQPTFGPQLGYASPQISFQQPIVQNFPKLPASPVSFSYQRIDNKFYAIGDYPTLFAVVNDFCSRAGLEVEKSDINLGCITIKYNYEFSQFVFFYQEADKIVIEAASNAIKVQFVINKQLRKLLEAIESGFVQYKNGQYMPNICYNAILPQAFQKAEIDYTSEAKVLLWGGPLLIVLFSFIGFLIAFIWGFICLFKIYSTKAKKGQEFVYMSFGADIIGLIINIVFLCILLG